MSDQTETFSDSMMGLPLSQSSMSDHDSCDELMAIGLLDPPRQPGTRAALDKFDIVRKLGEGGMGIVFLARDRSRPVAIKTLKPELAGNKDAVQRFVEEYTCMQNLEHAHIMPVFASGGLSHVQDKGAHTSVPWFAMPYMERGSVADLLKAGTPPNPDVALRISIDVASALRFAHMRGVQHRDIKPANVLIDADGSARLTDFGLGKNYEDGNPRTIDGRKVRIEGTVAYLPPEGANGEVGDTRWDVYTLGAMLYEMLSGKRPYTGDSVTEVIEKIKVGPPEPLGDFRNMLASKLGRVSAWAMERELRDRYASVDDVLEDLKRIERGEEPVGPQASSKRKTFGWINERYIRGVYASIIVVLATLLVVAWSNRNPDASSQGESAVFSLPKVIDLTKTDHGSGVWTRGDRSEYGTGGGGEATSGSFAKNGSRLVVSATTKQVQATAIQENWVDIEWDLKSQGNIRADIPIEIAMQQGVVAVSITEGQPIDTWGDPASIRLFESKVVGESQVSKTALHLTIEFSTSSNLAVVQTTTGDTSTRRVIDLSRLTAWKIRFYVSAHTSAGFPAGNASMMIAPIKVSNREDSAAVLGRVVDAASRQPVPNAVIRSDDGRFSTNSDEQGYFRLEVKSGQYRIRVEADTYESGFAKVDIGHGIETRSDFSLAKQNAGFGFVVESISFDNWHTSISAIAVVDNTVYYTARDGKKAFLYSVTQGQTNPTRIVELSANGQPLKLLGLAICNGDWIGIEQFPGRLYRIDHRTGLQQVGQIEKLAWPTGLCFDGEQLWFIESDMNANRFGIRALDRATLKPTVALIASDDKKIEGLAWGDGHLWISSGSGAVYKVDVTKARTAKTLTAGVEKTFAGKYGHLYYNDSFLWAVDNQNRQIVRIKVAE